MVRFFRVALSVAIILTVSACASSRSEISMVLPQGKMANPAVGTTVAIVRVDDLRRFEIKPAQPSTPSLSDDQINDVATTSRALARKRNGYGMAMGDVLLPKGETVGELVEKSVADGFRKAGYRVVEKGEPGYDQAIPVTLRVTEFWSWFDPGMFQVTITNRADVTLIGALPALTPQLTVQNETSDKMMAVVENDWKKIVQKGLDEISDKVALGLKLKSGTPVS